MAAAVDSLLQVVIVVVLGPACGSKGALSTASLDGPLATGGAMTGGLSGNLVTGQDTASSPGAGGIGGAGAKVEDGGDANGQGGRAEVSADMGALNDGDVLSDDAACDTSSLWSAVTFVTNSELDPYECFASPMGNSGTLTFNDEGKVTDISTPYIFGFSSKGAWLAWLANDRWPCLASQTIQYECDNPNCCGP